jgi:hypothetical protein
MVGAAEDQQQFCRELGIVLELGTMAEPLGNLCVIVCPDGMVHGSSFRGAQAMSAPSLQIDTWTSHGTKPPEDGEGPFRNAATAA